MNKRLINNNKKCEVGPNSEQKWGILKYPSAEFFTEKSTTNQGQMAYECMSVGS
jgi:hypothetical protein